MKKLESIGIEMENKYNSIEIKFWYSADGTPNINQDDIDNLGTNYISCQESRKLRESIRRTLKNASKSFENEGFDVVEGKLEIQVKK